MDFETKILLNNLIDAISNTNRTDWWMFGISLLGVVVSGIFSYMLWRISRQQCRIEKYRESRDLYADLYSIWKFCNIFLFDVYDIIQDSNKKHAGYEIIKLTNAVQNLMQTIMKNEVSIQLLLSKSSIQYMDLYSLLISADVVLKNLTHIIVSEDSEGYQPLFSLNLAEDNKDKDIINDIIEYAKKEDLPLESLHIQNFANQKYDIFYKANILDFVQKEITIS